jgi:hypothetical protein
MFEGNAQLTKKDSQSALSLLLVRPFDFSSPMPIDVCIARLQALSSQTQSTRSPVVCRVRSGDSSENAAVHFSLTKEVNIAHLIGSLNPSGEHETFVTGCGKIPTGTYVTGGVVFVGQSIIFLFLALSATPACLILNFVVLVGVLATWRFCLTERDKLVDAIKDAVARS